MQKSLLISLFLFIFIFSGCSSNKEIILNESIPANITNENLNVILSDASQIDAFGRLRVSEVTSLLDIKQLYDKDPLFIDEVVSGSGTSTYNNGDSSTTIKTVSSGDYVIRQTKQVTNYQSGKSHQIFMTFYGLQPQTNIIKRVGYFSSSKISPYNTSFDGLYLESSNGVISLNVGKNGVISSIPQSQFNLDTLNGSGTSGLNVDWSQDQILVIDMEWLGVGRLRWGLVVNGIIVPFHESNHANNIKGVYMQYPNQPLRWEIRQKGTGTGNFTHVCASVGTEGSLNTLGTERSVNTNGNPIPANVVGTKYASLGIRLNPNKTHSVIDILDLTLLSTTNDNYYYELILNPSVTNPLNFTSLNDSTIQYFIGTGTTTLTGGTVLSSGYVTQLEATEKTITSALRLGTYINGTTDVMYLAIIPLTSNMNVHSSLTFREVR